MRVGIGTINFEVYEDGQNFCGLAELTLPDLSQATTEVSGAGISGKFTAPFIGQMEAMNVSLTFKTTTDQTANLFTPGYHTLDLRVAQESQDATSGVFSVESIKHLMTATPVKHSLGKIAPSSQVDGSVEFSVSYYAQYIDKTKMIEFDLFNGIYYVNGTDYMAEVRKAMGRE